MYFKIITQDIRTNMGGPIFYSERIFRENWAYKKFISTQKPELFRPQPTISGPALVSPRLTERPGPPGARLDGALGELQGIRSLDVLHVHVD
jgi:hypothetical protein